ncbi:MAG: hypothetical protein RLZZ511_1424 [Cyanobacteriota bacterium]
MPWNLRPQCLTAVTLLAIGGTVPIPAIAQEPLEVTQERFEITWIDDAAPISATTLNHRQCPLRFSAGRTDVQEIAELQTQITNARRAKDLDQVGNTLNVLGNVYRDLGLYGQALKAYNESIAISRSSQSPTSRQSVGLEAASLAGRAYTELELGQYDSAIAGFEQALKLRRTMKFPPLEALTLNNLGIAYAATNNLPKAQAAYARGIQIATQDPQKQTVFAQWLHWNQANLKFATEGDATNFGLNQAEFVPPDQRDRANYGAFLNNLALVYERYGRSEEALTYYGYALQAFVPTGNFSCQRIVRQNQGRLLAQQGQIEQAIAAYYEAIGETSRVLRDRDLANPEKISYRSMVTPMYQELAALLRQQGRDQDAEALLQQLALTKQP